MKGYLSNFICIIFLILNSNILALAEFKLIEVNPGFNYAEWYKNETGFNANPQWFGAWVIAPRNDELYFGFGTARPAESDGALLAKYSGEWLIPLGQFSEQGVHCIKWVGDTLYGIGSDPSITDGWDGGNFYKYSIYSGEFQKVRYNIQKKPVLPNVIHSWGLCHDSANNKFYMSTGSYDPVQYSKNGGGCGNPNDSTLACFGQVWQSEDKGSSWTLNAGDRFKVLSNYRVYDIINFNNALYITDGEMSNTNKLRKSVDDGKTWSDVEDLNPAAIFRMCVFDRKLLVAANFAREYYIIDDNDNIRTLTFPGSLNYSFNVFANANDKYLLTYFSDGSVYSSYDLINWKELLPATGRNFLSISYWEKEHSIVLAERGDTGSIWKIDITDLLNTGINPISEQEFSVKFDNNTVKISSPDKEISEIQIFDVMGNLTTFVSQSESNQIKFDISSLKAGIYYVRYRISANYFIKKIMKY